MKKQTKRGPGRPPIWKPMILALRRRSADFIAAKDRTQAMAIYVCGRRMAIRIHVEKQPDGTYHCKR